MYLEFWIHTTGTKNTISITTLKEEILQKWVSDIPMDYWQIYAGRFGMVISLMGKITIISYFYVRINICTLMYSLNKNKFF